ncbi:Domain of uncharacterised function (DUF697) [Serratia rubidaea]|uniref:Domain of uncharacterized function (DUF697) n=1 Tax=Serratia rubidaea TaxID=61652 RepID=A0A4V6YXT3_SERRU|nr:Domain of uncharacterised function (DUF697) [Serratia rubidaea]
MSEPIKPRIDFEEPLQPPQEPTLRAGMALISSRRITSFPPRRSWSRKKEEGRVEGIVNAALKPKRSLWRKMVTAGLTLFGVSVVAQGVQWVHQAWLQQDWIALGGGVARRFDRRRRRRIGGGGMAPPVSPAPARRRARRGAGAAAQPRAGQGARVLRKTGAPAGLDQGHPALQRWQASLHETQNDREVVALYARLVQPVLDNQARREISRSAAESTLMIAVSPLALVDMAFIAWRNIRLINRIAALYGIELGYFSRIRLFRLVLLNIAFAGASELVREVGMDWVSQDLAARLSARARAGHRRRSADRASWASRRWSCAGRCRGWRTTSPNWSDFRGQLVGQLKDVMKKAIRKPDNPAAAPPGAAFSRTA